MRDANGVFGKREYVIYTEAEARELGLEVKHWRGAIAQVGDWIASDDGYVAQVVRVNGPYKWRGRDKYELVLPYGKTWTIGTGRRLEYEAYRAAGTYCWHAPNRWIANELKRSAFQRAVKLYAQLLVRGGGIVTDDELMRVGMVYKPHDRRPDWSIQRILKTHEGKTVVKKELAALMAEQGVTAGHVIRQHQDIVRRALDEGQLAVAEKANARFIEMLDLMPDKQAPGLSLTERVTFGHLEAHEEDAPDAEEAVFAEEEDDVSAHSS